MTKPLFKPIYRVISAVASIVAMTAVATVGQPVVTSLAAGSVAAPVNAAAEQFTINQPEEPGDQLIPGECVTAEWAPPYPLLYTVPPGGPTNISVRVAAQVALDSNTIQYQLYNPGSGYSGWININDFQQIDSRTIIMTATNVLPVSPIGRSFQSIQFKVTPVVGSVVACSPVHSIFAVTSRGRLPVILQNYADTVIAPVGYVGDPNKPFYNNDICRAANIYPGPNYSARFAENDNFFKFTTLTTSTFTATVSGFTEAGQLQLRIGSSACGTGVQFKDNVGTDVYQSTPGQTRVLSYGNVPPGKWYLRVVSASGLPTNKGFQINLQFAPPQNTGPYEPNNTACTAYPIANNVTYQAYPDDTSDWYSFTLASPLNIQLVMTNFVLNPNTSAGQYLLYKSDNCASLGNPLTVQDKSSTSYGPVALQAGKYFIRVAVGAGFQNTTLYNLRVNTSAVAAWNPTFERCAQLTGCSPDYSGNQVTVYWNNAPNMNQLRMRLGGRGAAGSCPASSTYDPITAGGGVYAASGSWQVLNVPTGSYDMSLFTTSSLGEQYASPVFQVNVNCSPTGAVTWSPRFDICSALTGCSSNFTGNRFTVYWTGTPGMNLLRMRLANRGATGSCPSAATVDPITADSSEWGTTGSWDILTVPTGSYDMSIYTTNTSGQQHASPVFRVNINCTPALTAAEAAGEGKATPEANAGQIGPYSAPLPTAIPDEPEATPIP